MLFDNLEAKIVKISKKVASECINLIFFIYFCSLYDYN